MNEAEGIRLLLYDTKYYYNRRCYDELNSRGVDITRLFSVKEIEKQDLSKFNGLIFHSGFQNQQESFEMLQRYPYLKIVVITSREGRGAYNVGQRNIAIFDVDSADKIYEYFSQKTKAQ